MTDGNQFFFNPPPQGVFADSELLLLCAANSLSDGYNIGEGLRNDCIGHIDYPFQGGPLAKIVSVSGKGVGNVSIELPSSVRRTAIIMIDDSLIQQYSSLTQKFRCRD